MPKLRFGRIWITSNPLIRIPQLVSFGEVIESSERFDATSQRVLDLYERGETEESRRYISPKSIRSLTSWRRRLC